MRTHLHEYVREWFQATKTTLHVPNFFTIRTTRENSGDQFYVQQEVILVTNALLPSSIYSIDPISNKKNSKVFYLHILPCGLLQSNN